MSASLALLLAVGGAYLAAHVAFDWLARRFLIVSAAEYLVLGILLGPQVSHLIDATLVGSLSPVITLALGWIGAIIGTQFELRRLLAIPPRVFRIAFAESAITLVVVGGLEYFLLRQSFVVGDKAALQAAIILGAMAVASSGVGVAVVAELLGARGGLVEQLRTSAAINNLFAIATFGLLLCVQHAPLPVSRPLTATEWVVVSAAIGIVGGALFHIFIGETPEVDRLFIALAGAVILVSGAAEYIRVSPLFAALFFGIALVNSTSAPERVIATLTRVERPFYYVLLLFGGASWVPSRRAWIGPVVVFVMMRGVSKLGGARLASRANGAIADLGSEWGLGLLGQGRVALAIGLNALHQEDSPYRNLIFTAAVASIIVSEFFSARLVRAVIERTQGRAIQPVDTVSSASGPSAEIEETPSSSTQQGER